MIKVSHHWLAALNGLIWLCIGVILLNLGLNFMVESILESNLALVKRPLLDPLSHLLGSRDNALIGLLSFCLLVGFVKGRLVFQKAVIRGIQRIRTLPNPAPLSQIYDKKYYILLGCMLLLSVGLRFVSLDIRGAIDIAVGVALVQGAVLYFRSALQLRGCLESPIE